MKKTKQIKTNKINPPKEVVVLTKDEFFTVLDKVVQPVPIKAKPSKKATSEQHRCDSLARVRHPCKPRSAIEHTSI